jgi:predicted  nucleic acid-binding Zn-ribbon protein
VVDLVGTFSDETALDSFITEGANEVINAMPRSMQERVAEETSFTNTTTSEGSKVLHVLRNDGTIDQPCRRIPARHRGRIQDSSDMQYATTSDPAYYIQDALVTIFPTGTGKLVSIPTYNQDAALNADGIGTIPNFPNEAEYLVTLYAAMKALQQNMASKSSSLPSDVTLPSAPVVPSISTVSYTDATNADATNEDAIVGTVVVPAKIDVSGNAPSFVSPVSPAADFSKVTSYVETDEDVELASSKIQQIQSQISDFTAKMQESTNKFNKDNVRYQMEFQEEVTKVNQDLQAELEEFRMQASIAQFNKQQDQALSQFNEQQDQALNLANAVKQMEDVIADNNSKLQQYSSELQKYQAEVSSEIQNYAAKIQKQTTDYQWMVGQYQQLSADYQRGIQLLTGAGAPQIR